MASKLRTPSKFLLVGFVIVIVLLLMGTTMYALFQTQQTQQHAALAQYTSIAVTGNIYVDTNKNGEKDTGEVNYPGKVLPKVKVALFSESCPSPTTKPSTNPTPTLHPIPTVSVTPPANCHYQTLCPRFACAKGGPCPTCTPTLVCTTPRPSGMPEVTGTTGQIEVIQGKSSDVKAAEDSTLPSQANDNAKDNGNDVCRELPERMIDCTVSRDGTYLCSATNVAPFTSASVSIVEPPFYKVTSKNPVIVSAAAAKVDFGLAPSGIVTGGGPSSQGLTSGDKLPFTIHVNGVTSGLPVVMYITEGKENSEPVSGVFTTDNSGDIVIKATPNDQITIVPVASKGYTTITPQRLQVTVSQNSCGLSSPCLFSATK